MSVIVDWKREHLNCQVVPADNPQKNHRGFVCLDHEVEFSVDSNEFPAEFLRSCIGCEEEVRTGCLRVHTCGKRPALAKSLVFDDDFSMTQHYFHD